MKRLIVIGLNQREAQAYAVEFLQDAPARHRKITSAEFSSTALQGVGPETEIHVLPRCIGSNYYNQLARQLQTLRARGVTVKTGEE